MEVILYVRVYGISESRLIAFASGWTMAYLLARSSHCMDWYVYSSFDFTHSLTFLGMIRVDNATYTW